MEWAETYYDTARFALLQKGSAPLTQLAAQCDKRRGQPPSRNCMNRTSLNGFIPTVSVDSFHGSEAPLGW